MLYYILSLSLSVIYIYIYIICRSLSLSLSHPSSHQGEGGSSVLRSHRRLAADHKQGERANFSFQTPESTSYRSPVASKKSPERAHMNFNPLSLSLDGSLPPRRARPLALVSIFYGTGVRVGRRRRGRGGGGMVHRRRRRPDWPAAYPPAVRASIILGARPAH